MTELESPDDNLRELRSDRNPNCGTSRERKKKNFPVNSSNLELSLAHSQNKGLSKYQRKASQLQTIPSSCKRQRGRPATARVRKKGAISAPETASSTKMWVGSWLLTKSFWDPGKLTSAGGSLPEISSPEETHNTPETALLQRTQGTERLGVGRLLRCTHWPPGTVCSPSSWLPEVLRPGKGTKCTPSRVCAFVGYLRTWTWAGENWEVHKTHGLLWTVPCRTTWSLSSVDWESTHAMSGGKPSVAQTLWALPTQASGICLQSSFLPTAQLNKWA